MMQLQDRLQSTSQSVEDGKQFIVTYSLKKGIAKFGPRGRDAALKEMKQLHDRGCFQPISKAELTRLEKDRALESLIFLVEKKDGTIKARHCANGSTQRDYMSREDVSSPTVSTEALFLTAIIDAEEGRDVMTCDIPNAFIQTDLQSASGGPRTIMKIRGVLVDILCEMDPTYKDFIVLEGKGKPQKVLYMHVIKAIYGLLVSAMLFYKKLTADLMEHGFELNPYDPCVANKIVNDKQLTVCWHVDDLKSSHVDPKVNDAILEWVKLKYGAIGEVKATRGKVHDYLGLRLDYSQPGKVSIDMRDYVKHIVDSFPQDQLGKPRDPSLESKIPAPWTEKLFQVDEESPPLPKDQAEQFHTTTAQALFACKRGRPDICPAVAFLTTRVREPNESDWKKLVRMVRFLRDTKEDVLTLESDGTKNTRWYADASFAVHPNMRSHTGGAMTLGKGFPINVSRKQSLNTRSSTEAEVVGGDDIVGPLLWTDRFLEAQGYNVKENTLFQDNQSAILLETNGRKSAGKRSRHLAIRYFFIADQQEKGHLTVRYCPTDEMVADYHTKPLLGEKFHRFRSLIMNLPTVATQLFMLGCLQP